MHTPLRAVKHPLLYRRQAPIESPPKVQTGNIYILNYNFIQTQVLLFFMPQLLRGNIDYPSEKAHASRTGNHNSSAAVWPRATAITIDVYHAISPQSCCCCVLIARRHGVAAICAGATSLEVYRRANETFAWDGGEPYGSQVQV